MKLKVFKNLIKNVNKYLKSLTRDFEFFIIDSGEENEKKHKTLFEIKYNLKKKSVVFSFFLRKK